jgi:hypothetical protein
MLLLQLNFYWFFVQTITGFAGALIALPFTFCNATTRCNWLFIHFYMISTPFHVYKEWKYIDKSLLKKLALSFFWSFNWHYCFIFGQPIILKKGLGIFILLFVLHNILSNKEIQIVSKMKFFGFLGIFSLVYFPLVAHCIW